MMHKRIGSGCEGIAWCFTLFAFLRSERSTNLLDVLHPRPRPWLRSVIATLGFSHWRVGTFWFPWCPWLPGPRRWFGPRLDISPIWHRFTRLSPQTVRQEGVTCTLRGLHDLLHMCPRRIWIRHNRLQLLKNPRIRRFQRNGNRHIILFIASGWLLGYDEGCLDSCASAEIFQNRKFREHKAVTLTIGVDELEDNTTHLLSWSRRERFLGRSGALLPLLGRGELACWLLHPWRRCWRDMLIHLWRLHVMHLDRHRFLRLSWMRYLLPRRLLGHPVGWWWRRRRRRRTHLGLG